jgi:glycosyltransferase involved in cell wall biosynthesis
VRTDDVTVIVPTRNEATNIAGFLVSLPDALRLIVVDSSKVRLPEIGPDDGGTEEAFG